MLVSGTRITASMPSIKEPDPLASHPKYEMVQRIKDAMYGFVVLARNKVSQELVAIRFFDNRWVPTRLWELQIMGREEPAGGPEPLEIRHSVEGPAVTMQAAQGAVDPAGRQRWVGGWDSQG